MLRSIVADVMVLIGLCGLGTGLWMLAPWLSLSVCGALMIVGGVLIELDRGGTDDREPTRKRDANQQALDGDNRSPRES